MREHFEPYLMTIAWLFGLGALLATLWGWGWPAPVGLGFCAACFAWASWEFAHAPEVED